MKKYSVFVGGVEVNNFYLSEEEAKKTKRIWEKKGYNPEIKER